MPSPPTLSRPLISALGNDTNVDAPTFPRDTSLRGQCVRVCNAYVSGLGLIVRKSKNSWHFVTRRLFDCSKQGYRQEPKKPRDESAGFIVTTSSLSSLL